MGDAQKKGPCRNRGRLPKLTAYEKNLNFIFLYFLYLIMQMECQPFEPIC